MCSEIQNLNHKKGSKKIRDGMGVEPWGWEWGLQGMAGAEDGTETFLGSSRAKLPGRGCSMPRLPFTLLQSQ